MSTHDDCTGYDFAAGKVTGLRSFAVDDLGRLTGVTFKRVWRPGENIAKCVRDDDNTSETRRIEGRCGDDAHGCGFWAYHDGSTYPSGDVTGVIEGWGKTTVGTKGFRCEKARIVALCIPKPKPGVVEVSGTRRRMLALYAAMFVWMFGTMGFDCYEIAATDKWFLAPLAALLALCAAYWAFLFRRELRRRTTRALTLAEAYETALYRDSVLSAEKATKVRRNYPDVPVYDSVADMLDAHPVDKQLEPSPDNDPEFWERDAEEKQDGGFARPSLSFQYNPSPMQSHLVQLQADVDRMIQRYQGRKP